MPLHVPPLFKLPAALACLRDDLLASEAPRSDGFARRLHVLRARSAARRLANESEIVQLSARYGFQTVVPEDHSIREQAAMFDAAEAVLGVKGAALTNIVFAKASCHLIVLSPNDFIDPFYWDIASVRGMAYSEVFGQIVSDERPAGRNGFSVDPVSVETALKRHLSRSP
jgi:capsular polysaccharide biosynthesis protein